MLLWDAFIEDYGNEIHGWSLRTILRLFWHYCQDGSCQVYKVLHDEINDGDGKDKLEDTIDTSKSACNDLFPCPFCGGQAYYNSNRMHRPSCETKFCAGNCYISWQSDETAIAMWNRRTK